MPEDVSQLTARDLLTQTFVRVEGQEPVSKLLAALKKANSTTALVFDGKKLLGLASDSALLRNVDISAAKIASIVRSLPSASPADKVEKMARLMRDGDVRILPVFEKGNLVGVVDSGTLLSRIHSHPIFDSLNAAELIASNPVSISADDPVSRAVKMMKDARVQKLIVIDSARKPVGVLRLEGVATDVLLSLKRGGKNEYKLGKGSKSISSGAMLEFTVKGIMDDGIQTVLPTEKGKSIVKKLSAQANPVLFVQSNGMTGMISVQSVLDAFLSAKSAPLASPIAIAHLPDIDEVDRANIEQMLQRTYDKVSRILKVRDNMHVVFKQSTKSGLRARTDVRITLSGVGPTLHVEATDWKVLLATKEACAALEAEVAKKYKRRSRGE